LTSVLGYEPSIILVRLLFPFDLFKHTQSYNDGNLKRPSVSTDTELPTL